MFRAFTGVRGPYCWRYFKSCPAFASSIGAFKNHYPIIKRKSDEQLITSITVLLLTTRRWLVYNYCPECLNAHIYERFWWWEMRMASTIKLHARRLLVQQTRVIFSTPAQRIVFLADYIWIKNYSLDKLAFTSHFQRKHSMLKFI